MVFIEYTKFFSSETHNKIWASVIPSLTISPKISIKGTGNVFN